jgi:hypothetical protein
VHDISKDFAQAASCIANLTSVQLELRPLNNLEGSSLVLKHLKGGSGDESAAALISAQLGGHPLAISQFTAYCSMASLSIKETLELLKTKGVSEIFSSSESSTSTAQYENTFETVWDEALELRSPEAKELLCILAFLHPDGIEEAILLAEHNSLPLIYPEQSKSLK